MKNILFFLLISLFLFSCNINKNRTSTDTETKKEIPEVLTKDKSESFDRINSYDLVESLYNDLMKDDEKLKELNENINRNFKAMNSVIEEFKKYKSKSEQYYANTESKINLIQDSLLKIKTLALIENSREKYNQLISNLNQSDSIINQTYSKIKSSYEVFKIQKTLPIIEKYQKEKLPDNKKLEDFIKEQNKLLEQIK